MTLIARLKNIESEIVSYADKTGEDWERVLADVETHLKAWLSEKANAKAAKLAKVTGAGDTAA